MRATTPRVLSGAWRASLLALAFALPFELTTPLIAAPWFNLTNVELLALVAITLGLTRAALLREPMPAPSAFARITALLLAVLLLASLLAPSENAHALKVTARWLAGAAIAWTTFAAVRGGLSGWSVLQSIAAGGIMVAALACLESAAAFAGSDLVAGWLAPFRAQAEFQVGGAMRPSSALAYPTIAAMVLEMTLFLAAGWCAQAWSQRRGRQAVALLAALLIVCTALVLTSTRAAWIATALSAFLVVAARIPHRGLDHFARVCLLVLAGLGLILLASLGMSETARLRLTSETDRDWYRARYAVEPLPPLHAGTIVTVPVEVRNVGRRTWEPSGANAVRLTYVWLTADGSRRLARESIRSDLPQTVEVGAAVRLQVPVRAPEAAGDYILAWDMVRENLFWFSALGAPLEQMPVRVLSGNGASTAPAETHAPLASASPTLERLNLWSTALRMFADHPLLGVGPGNFRLARGAYVDAPLWDNRLHANNMYLEMLADAGLLGGLVFLLWIAQIVRAGWRVLRHRERAAAAAALAAALAAFLLHGFGDYFLEFTPVYLLVWMTLGLLLNASARAPA